MQYVSTLQHKALQRYINEFEDGITNPKSSLEQLSAMVFGMNGRNLRPQDLIAQLGPRGFTLI